MTTSHARRLGSTYTPPDFARFLVDNAIKSPFDRVLDLGVGDGRFVLAAYDRLIRLGASPSKASDQIYGSEVRASAYKKFLKAAKAVSAKFGNIKHGDFFDSAFPQLDAIVGNPPYVRRANLINVDKIRNAVLDNDGLLGYRDHTLSRLTDLYVYFMLYALPSLKPGGRVAVITADTWLNTSYGVILKDYLLEHFTLEALVSFDRKVFDDVQVKPVMLLASRRRPSSRRSVANFVRVKNGLAIQQLEIHPRKKSRQLDDVVIAKIRTDQLDAASPWGMHLKESIAHDLIAQHRLMTKLENVATTRIGVQTLAKDFFVIASTEAKGLGIEREYLRPLAESPRRLAEPVITSVTQPATYLFYCAKDKDSLCGTRALDYIMAGEAREVSIRGKSEKVLGYHNKERIMRSGRTHWYDLRTTLERRGLAQILISRLAYRKLPVVWNQAGFVPGELFIEYMPKDSADVEVHLAVLSSTVSEIMLRASANVYGGGTYNIQPGQIKNTLILNIHLLTGDQRALLKKAYRTFLAGNGRSRAPIDSVVFDILGYDLNTRQIIDKALQDLVQIATDSKR